VAGVDLRGGRTLVDPSLAALLVLEVLDRVGEIHGGPVDAGVVETLTEDPSRRADERLPRQVLAVAGLLAHQDDARITRSVTENGLGGRAEQRTSRTVPGRGGQDAEAAARRYERSCRPGLRDGGDRGFRAGSGTPTVGG
jgi:hypothetical protein